MPLYKELREGGRVLYIEIADSWHVQHVQESHTVDWGYLDTVKHKVHTMIVMRSRRVPEGLFSTWHTSPTLAHPNSGHLLVVNAPPEIQDLAKGMFMITGYDRGHFFDNEADAWEFVRARIVEDRNAEI